MNRVVGCRLSGNHCWSLGSCRWFCSESWTSSKVRQTFIDFFLKQDHRFVPSSSVVPKKNEGSYFVNAGMNQFKPLLLGSVDPRSEMASFRRVVNSQKCIRVGGKHNDLEDVGRDTYHHTFFEMLGNWSFADYFKKEACSMAWHLLTEVYGLPRSRLYVTYFGGCKELGLEPDVECRDIWKEIGVSPERVLPFGMKDNFWVMGNTGPCGPCTEIHFDHLDRPDGSSLVNVSSPEVIELWNLVFMQFDRQVDGSLRQLPMRHVDTGMGLERVTAVLQGQMSNYDTDLFTPLFHAIHQACHCPPYSGSFAVGVRGQLDMAYRIVADHTRMLTVAIGDGLLPGRRESEAKLRQVMHRCIHQSTQVLGSTRGFVGNLSSVVVDVLGHVFPELAKNRDQIKEVTNQTEARYLESLVIGRQVLAKALFKYGDIKTLSGDQLMEIQDGRFGKSVPADVISLLAEDFGITADMENYEEIRRRCQDASVASATPSIDSSIQLDLFDLDYLKRNGICSTDDSFKYDYVWTPGGYDFKTIDAKVVSLMCNGQFVDRVDQGSLCGLLLDKTNFYAEAGGQAADQGLAITDKGDRAWISDVQSMQDFVLHVARLEHGSLVVGDTVRLSIDQSRRSGCMLNHTATHLLSFCLNRVLGNVRQQGSAVTNTRLTFEFTCSKTSVTNEDLSIVSELANHLVHTGSRVFRSVVPLDEARRIRNLVTLMDEVYPVSVNVVSIGVPVAELLSAQHGSRVEHNSVELCCGTHVDDISHLGMVVITHLQGSSQGTKRLIAVTGQRATEALENAMQLKMQLECVLNSKAPKETMDRVQNIETALSDGRLLPKVDREFLQKELERVVQLQQVNRAKNETKLSSLAKTVGDLLRRERSNSASAVVTQFSFSRTRDIVEVLVRLAPDHPTVIISSSEELKEVIVGIVYVPKEGDTSFTSSDWAGYVCRTLDGSHSLPKGKLAKHLNVQVFSIPLRGSRTQQMDRIIGVVHKFLFKMEKNNRTGSNSKDRLNSKKGGIEEELN